MTAIANARLMLACIGLIASFVPAHAACSRDEQSVVGAHIVNRGAPLADRSSPLVVCNLVPNQNVRVTSILWMGDSYYASRLEFHVTDDELNTAKLAPTRGPYAGIEPDGYLWSMRPERDPPAELQRLANRDPRMLVVGVAGDKGPPVFAQIKRNFGHADLRAVETDGLHGRLFRPMQQAEGRDVVLLLPDTQGPTVDERMATLLASRGNVVLALEGPDGGKPQAQRGPEPIEYFSRAVDFLRREYAGASGRIDVVAFGRATEAAAMLALTRRDIARIVLVSPSSVINAAEERGMPGDRPAWTLRGAPLAFAHRVADEADVLARQSQPYATRQIYDMRVAAAAADDRAHIPFDLISSDIVLIACDQDAVWPADRMAQNIRVLASRGRANITMHILSDCGHDLVAPIAPTTRRDFVARDGVRLALGGTPRAVWEGQRAAWDIIRHAIGGKRGEP